MTSSEWHSAIEGEIYLLRFFDIDLKHINLNNEVDVSACEFVFALFFIIIIMYFSPFLFL